MDYEPIVGKPVRFPPGRVQIRLDEQHRSAYRALYAHYQSILAGVPVLKPRDLDGRAVLVSPAQLAALNAAFSKLLQPPDEAPTSVFESQEAARSRLFKRLQYLS